MLQDISAQNSVTMAMIALGSNVTSRSLGTAEIVNAAFSAVSSESVQLVAHSRLFTTPCVPAGAGPDYINAAALISTSLTASELLSHLHEVEQRFDRRREARWAPRTLDLDLLDYGGQILPDRATWDYWHDLHLERQMVETPGELILPHPRIQDRAFVLVPVADIAPDWTHPVLGQTVTEMCASLTAEDMAGISPFKSSESLALPAKGL